jgi:hypothetical protein
MRMSTATPGAKPRVSGTAVRDTRSARINRPPFGRGQSAGAEAFRGGQPLFLKKAQDGWQHAGLTAVPNVVATFISR